MLVEQKKIIPNTRAVSCHTVALRGSIAHKYESIDNRFDHSLLKIMPANRLLPWMKKGEIVYYSE